MHSQNLKKLLRAESRDSLYYVGTTFVSTLASFIIVPLFWRELTPFDFGIMAVVDMINLFVSKFMGLSLESSITRFYYEWDDSEKKKNTGTLLIVNWSTVLVIGVISLFVLSLTSKYIFKKVSFYPFLLLGISNGILIAFTAFPFSLLRIKRKAMLFAILRLSTFCVQISLNIIFVLVLKQGVVGYYKSNLIVNGIIIAAFIPILWSFVKLSFNRKVLSDALKFSLPLMQRNILVSLYSVVDRFVLQNYYSLEVLGIYNIGMKFANVISALYNALKMSYTPFLYQKISEKTEEAKNDIFQMVKFYIAPVFICGLLISLYIDNFVVLIGQEEYFPVVDIVPWLVGFSLLNSLYIYYSPGLLLSKRTRLLLIPTVVQIVAIFLTSILIIPHYGLTGVIISKYICVVLFLSISLFLSKKMFDMKYDWKSLLKFILVYVVAVVAHTIINRFSELDIWIEFVVSTVIVGISVLYFFFVLKNNIFSKKTLK